MLKNSILQFFLLDVSLCNQIEFPLIPKLNIINVFS